MTLAVQFYDGVVALHVMAVVIAFGVTFTYPAILPWLGKNHPESMPVIHRMQVRIGRMIITPFAIVILVTGIYLASDRDLWSETWVTIPLVILIALLGLGHAYFTPKEERLAELAERDLAAGGLGPEYGALAQQVGKVGAASSLFILLAIYCMVAKPFM